MQDAPGEVELRDEEGGIRSDFLHAVVTALETGDTAKARELTLPLHEADLADLIELLRPEERGELIAMLGSDFNAAALPELDEAVRNQVLEAMPPERVAEALQQLDSDEAVYVIEDLDKEDRSDILAKLPYFERIALERSLEYPEDSAGRIMQTDLIAVPPFWSVGQTIDYMRVAEDLPDRFYEVFVVDPAYHLLGSVALNRLLRSKRPVTIAAITDRDIHPIAVEADQEEVAHQFERYNLTSAPVVDKNGRLVGVITADDIVEVVQEEASEDILRMGGVGGESVSDSVWRTTRHRFTWLLVNLGTALLAASVIGLFEATIEQMVALAVLMPIVASMGGNAGNQTMTVTVRALAMRNLGAANAFRVIGREAMVGLLNGFAFALLLGTVVYFWFGNDELGVVIAAAMVVNFFVAALAGILIPLMLDYLDIDPAVASGVFVTTLTDVVGFFAFLGLATLWLV
jgi:magnesium transporter